MKLLVTCLSLLLSAMLLSSVVFAQEVLPRPEALSKETIYLTEKLSKNYDTLLIRDFSEEGAEYSRVNAEEKAKITQMMPLLKSNIRLSLEAALKEKNLFKTVLAEGKPSPRTVVLEGSFSEFNAGSRAVKFFVGFGGGKAYIKFKGRIIDGATGKELATFEDRETGYRGAMSMESFEDLFPHQAKSIGGNLGNFFEKLY